jgi:hypothetical protein
LSANTAFERITDALREHGATGTFHAAKAHVRCPAHEDRNPSLSITAIEGQTLIHCQAGCHFEDVLAAIKLRPADMFDEPKGARYQYQDAGGRPVRTVHRTPAKKFHQSGDTTAQPTLYRLPQVIAAVEAGRDIYLVEGEKDVHALETLGVVATTAPMGASNFTKVDVSPLKGADVLAIPDADSAGQKWLADVAAKLSGMAASLTVLAPVAGCKDAADHIGAGHGVADLTQAGPQEPFEPPDEEEPLYVDIAALLAGGLAPPPEPVALRRKDGKALFYAGKVNILFGDPECGKTWIALAGVAQILIGGRRAGIIDVDHNGAHETVGRLKILGVRDRLLADPTWFRYYEPEDETELRRAAYELRQWRAAFAVVDSLGEVLPMLGLSSNSPDDYSVAHRDILTMIANGGAAVVGIDHMPKSEEARQHGQTGTLAKRRAVNGVSLRVTNTSPFAPGRGGAASLTIAKDRPGGLRAVCPADGKYQPAGRFVMTAEDDGGVTWEVTEPSISTLHGGDEPADVAELDALDPPPASQRDVQKRLGWGGSRAAVALKAWRETRGVS